MPVAARGNRIRQDTRDLGQIGGNIREPFAPAHGALIHIEVPAHFDLHGMAIVCGIAIMFGYEAPGVRLVALYTIAAAAQLIFDGIDEIRGATRSITIAHDEIRPLRYFDSCGPRRLVGAQRARRHGMAIDEDGDTKPLPRPVDAPAH